VLRALPLGGATESAINSLVHAVPVAAAIGWTCLTAVIARDLGAPRRAAIAAALAALLCTEMFVYARSFFTASLAALMVTIAVYGYLDVERRRWIAALGTAGLVLARPQLVFVALALVAVGGISKSRRASIIGVGTGLAAIAVATLIHMAYNYARFGNVTDFGGDDRTLHASALAPGAIVDAVALLLVSPGRGLLVYSPLAIVGLAGIVRFAPARFTRIAVAVFLSALFVGVLNPGGGVNWGTRYLAPVIPIAIVGLALLPRSWRPLYVLAGLWGFLVSLPTAVIPFESSYRAPVAAQVEPKTIYWSLADGPIVRLWDQLPGVFGHQDAWLVWWREVPGQLVPIAVLFSVAAVIIAGALVWRSMKDARGPEPARPSAGTRSLLERR
jgi:hypothetical protein